MLDLGFREDLETLLGAAPVERRTLLLSATLPSEIRAMARRFQRDALAIDPRNAPSAPGSGRASGRRRARRHHLRRAPDRRRRSPGGGGEPAARLARRTRDRLLHDARRGRRPASRAGGARLRRDRDLRRTRAGGARPRAGSGAAGRGADPGRHQRRRARSPPARRRSDRARRSAAQRRVADPPQWSHRPRRAQGHRGGDRQPGRAAQGRAAARDRAGARRPGPRRRRRSRSRRRRARSSSTSCSPMRRSTARRRTQGRHAEPRQPPARGPRSATTICWRRFAASCPSRIWRAGCSNASSRACPTGEKLLPVVLPSAGGGPRLRARRRRTAGATARTR